MIIAFLFVFFEFLFKAAPLIIVLGLAIYFTFSQKHKDEYFEYDPSTDFDNFDDNDNNAPSIDFDSFDDNDDGNDD